MISIFQDIRFALRQLRRKPFFSLTILFTLALSMGAAAALAGVLRTTLLYPLPYPHSEQLVTVKDVNLKGFAANGLVSVARADNLAHAGGNRPLFQRLGFFYSDDSTLALADHAPERVPAAAVSGEFFNTLGSTPLLGRTIVPADDHVNGPEVVVISERLWRSIFAADPQVIGHVVKLGTTSATVVGVMPRMFSFPIGVEVWHPGHILAPNFAGFRGDNTRFVAVIGRLAPGQTLGSARISTDQLAQTLARTYSVTDAAWGFLVNTLRDSLFGDYRQALTLLATAVGLVLLVTALNLAALQLSRNASRAPEFAVRRALGVTRRRLVRQLMTESVLLVMTGTAGGLCVGVLILKLLNTRLPPTLLVLGAPRVDSSVLVLSLLAALVVGVATATLPALESTRRLAGTGTRTLVGQRRAFSRGFAVVEIAIALVLLTLAMAVLGSLYRLLTLPLGYQASAVETFSIDLPWGADPHKVHLLYQRLEQQFRELPGVSSAGSMSALPLSNFSVRRTFDVMGQASTTHHDAVVAEGRTFSPGYLATMQIPLLEGRGFVAADSESGAPKVVIINQTLSRRYFAGGSALGKRLTSPVGTAEIVGVIGDVHGTGGSLSSPLQPEVYEPEDGSWPHMQFVLRAGVPMASLEPRIRSIVQTADATASVGDFHSLSETLERTLQQPRLNASLVTGFAALSLLLVVIGVYGLIAFDVAERARELGLRLALGSTRRGVLRLVMRGAVSVLAAGLVLGVAGSLLTLRLIDATHAKAHLEAGAMLLSTSSMLSLAVMLATLMPALRAASLDPMDALRAE